MSIVMLDMPLTDNDSVFDMEAALGHVEGVAAMGLPQPTVMALLRRSYSRPSAPPIITTVTTCQPRASGT